MLKICGLAACPFPANQGTPGSIREMSEAIAELGHEVHIVTYHFGEATPVKGFQLHRIPALTRESKVVIGPTTRRPLYDFQMIFTTLQVIRRHKPDVLHAHGYEAALVAWFCKILTGVPVVYSGHNTMSDELPSYNFIRPRWLAVGLARFLDKFVPRIGDRCIPHSRNIEKFLHDQGLAAKTTPVISFGIDLDAISGAEPIDVRGQYNLGPGPVVVYTGLMDRFQRIDLLMEAMVPVLRQIPAARLLIIVTIPNDEHLEAIRKKSQQLGIAERVVFTPPQPLANIGGILKSADVAVVPRPSCPGFPIKLLNYMAARCPSILFASSSSGLTHGENAYLVSPDTSEALGKGILDLLTDPALGRRLAASAYDFVYEQHDRRVMARKVSEVYSELVEAKRRRGARGRSEPEKTAPSANETVPSVNEFVPSASEDVAALDTVAPH